MPQSVLPEKFLGSDQFETNLNSKEDQYFYRGLSLDRCRPGGAANKAKSRTEGPFDMRKLLCGLLLVAGCALGQGKVSRLGQITFDPHAGVVSWTVQQGAVDENHKFTVKKELKYSIDFRAATMSDGQETRKFSEEEAEEMYDLFNAIVARYAQESTDWWTDPPSEQTGPGAPVTKV